MTTFLMCGEGSVMQISCIEITIQNVADILLIARIWNEREAASRAQSLCSAPSYMNCKILSNKINGNKYSLGDHYVHWSSKTIHLQFNWFIIQLSPGRMIEEVTISILLDYSKAEQHVECCCVIREHLSALSALSALSSPRSFLWPSPVSRVRTLEVTTRHMWGVTVTAPRLHVTTSSTDFLAPATVLSIMSPRAELSNISHNISYHTSNLSW